MKENKLGEKQKIMLIGLVVVIAIICCIVIRGIVVTNTNSNAIGNTNTTGNTNINGNTNVNNNTNDNISENPNGNTNEKDNNKNEKYVEVLEDKTKLNTSEKIKEENRIVGSYEFSRMEISSKDNQTLITAVVKNIGTTKTPLTAVDITLLDEKNKEMITLKKSALVAELEPNESTTVTVYCSTDFANAYDAKLSI